MTRSKILAVIALLVATPVIAQQAFQIQPIQRPVVTPKAEVIQQDSDAAQKVMTIEEAKAKIAQLARQKRDLNAKLTDALARIDAMTKPGGSLVRAYCAGPELSRNTAGAEENCAASGYACGPVEGTCRRSCTISDECAGTHNCENGVCVPKNKYAE